MGFTFSSMDLMIHNRNTTIIVRSCKRAKHDETHRRGRASRFDDTPSYSCISIAAFMYERIVFVFLNPRFVPSGYDWVSFTGCLFLSLFCMKDKKSVFTFTCSCLPGANRGGTFSAMLICFLWHQSKGVLSTSLPLIWSGLPVICSVETNHTGLLIDSEVFLKSTQSLSIQKPNRSRCRL